MKKINEFLVQRLAYEKRLCIYILAQKKEISQDEIESYMYDIEHLTKINLSAKDFTFETISQLGLNNCCTFFKALCEQYSLLANPDNEFSSDVARQHRCDIEISSKFGKKGRKMDIGLYDCASLVDKIIDSNYNELKDGCMKGNPDDSIYRYAQISTFASMYYRLRDVIEGKSYYDGLFMTEYRELPIEYEAKSNGIISSYARCENISNEEAKTMLLDTLNQGMKLLFQTPIKVEPVPTSFGFKK